MSVTFSLFGYFVSFQLFKNLFVPIERLDGQDSVSSLDDLTETEFRPAPRQESKAVAP